MLLIVTPRDVVQIELTASESSFELSDDDCVLHFRWPTSYACPECTSDDYTAVRGPCEAGWTDIEYILSGTCVGGIPLPMETLFVPAGSISKK